MTTAYYVITHGSRSPRSVVHRQNIECYLQKKCPDVVIGGGCLEGMPQSLGEQMAQFAQTIKVDRIMAIPLFLLKGVHTQADIPAEMARQDSRWRITPILGDSPKMANLLQTAFDRESATKILLTHGSNFPGATIDFLQLATTIGAQPAYWMGEPTWQSYGTDSCVLPYFFAGSLILTKLQEQGANVPSVKFLDPPLTPDVVAQLARELAEAIQ